MFLIRASEAASNGLPAVGIQLDAEDKLIVSSFPEPDLYVTGSGPPGGRLVFEVWSSDATTYDAGAARRAVEKRFNVPGVVPTVWGPNASLVIAGESRPAVAFLSDKSFMQTGWCATLVPHPAGALLVAFGIPAAGATTVTCDQVVAHPAMAPIVRSFAIVPP